MNSGYSSTRLLISRVTTLLVLSLFLGIIMNTKIIEQQHQEISSEQDNDVTSIDQLFSSLFDSLKIDESENTQLPIILSDLKPPASFQELQFKLHGVVYSGKEQSYALISKNGGVQEVYQQDSLIYKNTILKNISKNHVLIDFYGEGYKLKMEFQGPSSVPDYLHQEKQKYFQQQQVLDQDKRRNPIRLLMIRRPYAVYEKGQFLGYKIMPGSNTDQFIRLGFKRGDIITSLNGLTLDKPGLQPFIISELTHSRNIDLVILRDEGTVSILYGF